MMDERQLPAILLTDVAGYTKLTEAAQRLRIHQPRPNGDWRLETRPASVKNTEPAPAPG